VEFEEVDGLERVTIDSDVDDSDGEGDGEVPEELADEIEMDKSGNPEGEQRLMDHQEIPRTSGNGNRVIPNSCPEPPIPINANVTTPPTFCRSMRINREIPCIHADEDPKLELSSRSPAKRDAPPDLPSVGMRGKTTNKDGSPPHANEEEINALYLTVDVPCSY